MQKVLRTDDVTDFACTPHLLTDDNVCKKFANNIYCIKSTAAQEQTVKVWSIQLWRIHHKRHGGAFFWGWCVNFVPSKKSCTAVCPEKLHTCPRRRTQRSEQGSHTERPGEFLAALVSVQNVTKVAKKQKRSYFKVLDAKCKGIDGAIVEVWYAGGVPGFQKNLSTEGSTLWSCHHSLPLVRLVNYSHITSLSCFVRWDGVQFPSESLTTERSALWPCHPLCWIHLVT